METVKALEGLRFVKKCCKCGRELPLSEFHLNRTNKDGHSATCKDCVKAYDKERNLKKRAATKKRETGRKAQQIPLKADISNLSDSELFAELKKRGYTGELHFSKVVNL